MKLRFAVRFPHRNLLHDDRAEIVQHRIRLDSLRVLGERLEADDVTIRSHLPGGQQCREADVRADVVGRHAGLHEAMEGLLNVEIVRAEQEADRRRAAVELQSAAEAFLDATFVIAP